MSRPGPTCAEARAVEAGPAITLRLLRMAGLALVVMSALHAAVATANAEDPAAGDAPRADSLPPTPQRGARPEQDADAGDHPGAGARIRPRQLDEGELAPRAGEGCPYRGRKLDLIV